MLQINIKKLKGAYSNLGGVLDVQIKDNTFILTIQDLATKEINQVDGNKSDSLIFFLGKKELNFYDYLLSMQMFDIKLHTLHHQNVQHIIFNIGNEIESKFSQKTKEPYIVFDFKNLSHNDHQSISEYLRHEKKLKLIESFNNHVDWGNPKNSYSESFFKIKL